MDTRLHYRHFRHYSLSLHLLQPPLEDTSLLKDDRKHMLTKMKKMDNEAKIRRGNEVT